jgi:plastocyanin domain-containing protein
VIRSSSIVFVALAGLLLGGCASTPPAEAPEVVKAVPDGRGVQRVSVIAGNYYFRPSRIVVKAGSPVEVTIRKEGLIPHTFTIDAPAAGISVDSALSSEPSTVSFTPKAPGTYRFVCTKKLLFFASHLERGMQGTLEVVP